MFIVVNDSKMFIRMLVIGYILCCIPVDSTSTTTNLTSLRRIIRQTQKCRLPSYPHNGHWALLSGYGNPGEEVASNSIIQFSCNERYKLDGNEHIVCINDRWNVQKMPKCEPTCAPQFSTSTTFLQCIDKRGQKIECTEATSGSYMKYDCTGFYEPTPGQRKVIYCTDGVWSNETPECRPICGRRNDAMTLIYGGTTLTKLIYPWIVAIYRKDETKYINICGGTIIHRKVVLTAAHCVTNDYADPYPVEHFYIAGAKLYNKYNDSRDTDVQYSKISQIIVHPQYKGDSQRFIADIALMVTDMPFKLNSLVRPVCIYDLPTIFIQPGSTGEIAGWGATESGLPSDELRALEIPHRDEQICIQELPSEWASKYSIFDKMCAGHPEKKVSVCKGDSGSGLAFKNVEDNRYYVHGIVSLSPSTKNGGTCNIFTNALYTKVSIYYDFIDVQLNRMNWCILPNHPKNGKWVFQRSSYKAPGDRVSPYDIIEVFCNKGYNLTSQNSKFSCETLISNVPSCIGNQTQEKNLPTPPLNDNEDDCGRKVNGSNFHFPDGKPVRHLDCPWAVPIYRDNKFYAHGTIISKKLVITVLLKKALNNSESSPANLLAFGEVPNNPARFRIAAGKYYRDYSNRVDEDAKYYEIEKIILPNEYQALGAPYSHYGDFCFALIKGAIEFNQWVKPVCVKGVNNLLMLTNSILEITGWENAENIEKVEPAAKKVILHTAFWCSNYNFPSYLLAADVICGNSANNSIVVRHPGAGLTYENPIDRRHYLAGILKYSVSDEKSVYLAVQNHYDSIVKQIIEYT